MNCTRSCDRIPFSGFPILLSLSAVGGSVGRSVGVLLDVDGAIAQEVIDHVLECKHKTEKLFSLYLSLPILVVTHCQRK